MKDDQSPTADASRPAFRILEYVTAGVLLLVLGGLGCMTAVAYWPVAGDTVIPDLHVIGAIVLLLAALVLVSVVALLHTRK